MAAGAATLVLKPDHRSGTTWRGFSVLIEDATSVDDNGDPVYTPRNLADYTARMQLKDELGTVVWDLNSATNGGITITPASGVVAVDGLGVLTATPGRLVFDLKLTSATTEKLVELDGEQAVIEGVTA